MNDFSTPQEVQQLLTNVRCPWGVVGGWSLDLFLNRVTRKHKHIEVAIFREDQLILQEYLSAQGGFFEYVCNGQLFPWKSGERLELPIHEIRCRISSGSLRCLEILLNERTEDSFIFRRDSRIGAPIAHTFLRSKSGISILTPEIVLLYKSRGFGDVKEQSDFSNVLDALDGERCQWLFENIATINPEHPWLTALKERKSGE
jgi:hypothetical protein